jgi:hypothetical protein
MVESLAVIERLLAANAEPALRPNAATTAVRPYCEGDFIFQILKI